MKNIFKILSLIILGAILYSCERNDALSVVDLKTKPEIISALSATSYVINDANLNNTFETIIFKKPSYGSNVEIESQLEIAIAGNDFAKPYNIGTATSSNFVKLTNNELNNVLINMGLAPNVPANVELRVKCRVKNSSGNQPFVYSSPISFIVTPYTANPDDLFPKISIPGNYDVTALGSGYKQWDLIASPKLYSNTKDSKYSGFQYMPITGYNGFKFTINESWTDDKGDDGTFTGKLVKDGEKDCYIKEFPAYNTYFIKVDWAENTYSLAKANMGIVGDATPIGWSGQIDLAYNPTNKKYEIPNIALTPGIFKFKNDDTWSIKLQPKNGDVTIVSGKEVQIYNSANGEVTGDPSFKITESGNYKIVVDLHNSGYYNMTVTKL